MSNTSINFWHERTSILDFITDGRPQILGKGRTTSEHINRLERMQHAEGRHFYAVTITFHDKTLRRRGLHMPKVPECQFRFISPHIESDFKGFDYCFWTEWTKNGMIHFHGVISHKTIHISNSLILHSVRTILSNKYGKMNANSSAVNDVTDFRKFLDYCSKEDNHILSNIFDDSESNS
jgi:hypothetical protein